MSNRLVLLFALAGGIAVGNLYWAQPLLTEMGNSLKVGEASASLLVTITQIGYALGVFLIVPLGDVVNRQRLVPVLVVCSSVALAACALAPSYSFLTIGLLAVGLSTVTGQLLTPLAGDLVEPDRRGKVIGQIVSGLLTGILLSRTISGFVGDLLGWRAIYWIAALVSMIIGVVLFAALPRDTKRQGLSYPSLLKSVFTLVRRYRTAQITLLLGAIVFCVFSMFWTGLTFLLSTPPFSYSLSQIGLVGLAGLAGALAAQRSGVLHDKGLSVIATGVALIIALCALAIAGLGKATIITILVAVLVFDIAVQTMNVLNQTRLFSVDASARSRLNTAFVSCNFIGGSIGSSLAGLLWEHGGWKSIILIAMCLLSLAFILWWTAKADLQG